MPFPGFRRYSFSATSIRQNAPSSPGVYGISNAKEWILVAAADDVQFALLEHLKNRGTALLARAPTGFTFDPCDETQIAARQRALIAELHPTCNQY